MSTTVWYFTGPCKWAKVYKSQLDPKYKRWSIDVYLDNKNLDDYKRSGMQLEVREDEDGKFVRFSRASVKIINKEVVEFDPPEVVRVSEEGNSPFNDPIGNGSIVVVKVAVFDTQKGKGHRLDKVGVIEHVPYSTTNVGNVAEGEKVPI